MRHAKKVHLELTRSFKKDLEGYLHFRQNVKKEAKYTTGRDFFIL